MKSVLTDGSTLFINLKMAHACRLLDQGSLEVRQIAEQLGFNSPAYFTRAFQHLTGKSPTAFRRAG